MTERDKWGRIPVKLIEVDQEFCALRWGELPCEAGPQSNILLFTDSFGQAPNWSTDNTVDNSYTYPACVLEFTTSDFAGYTIPTTTLLPNFVSPKTLFGSFEYDPSRGSGVCSVGMRISFTSSLVASFEFDTTDESIVAQEPEVKDLTFSDSEEFPLRRVTFRVESSDFVPDGNAFIAELAFSVAFATGTGDFVVTKPQICLDELTEYRETGSTPKTVSTVPCFNTLSSCQAPQTYSIDGRADALAIIVTA